MALSYSISTRGTQFSLLFCFFPASRWTLALTFRGHCSREPMNHCVFFSSASMASAQRSPSTNACPHPGREPPPPVLYSACCASYELCLNEAGLSSYPREPTRWRKSHKNLSKSSASSCGPRGDPPAGRYLTWAVGRWLRLIASANGINGMGSQG